MKKDIAVTCMLCMLVARSTAASYASAMIARYAEIDGWQHLIRLKTGGGYSREEHSLGWAQIGQKATVRSLGSAICTFAA